MNQLGTKRLETERLILRKLEVSDIEPLYYNYGSDPQTASYVMWDKHKNIDETREYVESCINAYNDNKYLWVVELKELKEPIGMIELLHIHSKYQTAEVAYAYGSKWWRNGYATEALKKVLHYGFCEVGLAVIEARHFPSNPASGKVMEKAGMKYEGRLRKRMINPTTKEIEDLLVYLMLKEEEHEF